MQSSRPVPIWGIARDPRCCYYSLFLLNILNFIREILGKESHSQHSVLVLWRWSEKKLLLQEVWGMVCSLAVLTSS